MNDNALMITTSAAVLPAPSRVDNSVPRSPELSSQAPAASSVNTRDMTPPAPDTMQPPRSQSRPTHSPLTTDQSPPVPLSSESKSAGGTATWFEAADPEVMEKVVESINSFLQSLKRNLEFSVDQDTGRPIIKVWDAEHAELIRQIPPDETLKLVEHFLDGNGIQTTGLTDKA